MKILSAMSLCSSILLAACQPAISHTTQKDDDKVADWKTFLKEELPLLGHRNWIVVTDMAYPLQTNPGIKTIFAAEPFTEQRTLSSLCNGHMLTEDPTPWEQPSTFPDPQWG